MAKPATTRDSQGRFSRGNAGGPGRPKGGGTRELQQAITEAVGPEHMQAIMRKALILALNGNLSAMKFVADRACGKPTDAPAAADPIDIELPRLRNTADCDRALDVVVQGVCSGTVDRDTARLFTDLIQARVKTIEAKELEQRIAELEQTLSATGHQPR